MTRPSVSVVIPVYNRPRLVSDAVTSVRAQGGVDLDIIVIDDGSTDETAASVSAIAAVDSRVRLFRRERLGPAAARNAGVEQAKGIFLSFVDSDDLCPPGRLHRQATKLMVRPDITAVVGALLHFESVDETGSPRQDNRYTPYHDAALHCAMFRTDKFRNMGPLDETLSYAEDVDFFLRLLEDDARILIEVDVASFYRCHTGNMTNDARAKQTGYVKAYARSVARRRASHSNRRLRSFFPAVYMEEVEIGGGLAKAEG